MLRVSLGTVLIAAALLAGCEKRQPSAPADFSGLEIRPEPKASEMPAADPATGLVTAEFSVPLSFALELLRSRSPEKGEAPDPFAAAPTENVGLVQKAIESLGIPFPKGAMAGYDARKGLLTVTQTPEAMGLIAEILEKNHGGALSVALRVEIYEVPAMLALRLEQSAAAHGDHEPEWVALRRELGQGHARLIELATLQSRPEARAKYEQGRTHLEVTGFDPAGEGEKGKWTPQLEERLVGTTIEFDNVVESDDQTIGLNLLIEYHTAPPERKSIQVDPAPGNEGEIHQVTVFHQKKLITQLTVRSGQTKLLVSWLPTGKPEYSRDNVRHIVFLRADARRNFGQD